jgi:hypothetical protein
MNAPAYRRRQVRTAMLPVLALILAAAYLLLLHPVRVLFSARLSKVRPSFQTQPFGRFRMVAAAM